MPVTAPGASVVRPGLAGHLSGGPAQESDVGTSVSGTPGTATPSSLVQAVETAAPVEPSAGCTRVRSSLLSYVRTVASVSGSVTLTVARSACSTRRSPTPPTSPTSPEAVASTSTRTSTGTGSVAPKSRSTRSSPVTEADGAHTVGSASPLASAAALARRAVRSYDAMA